MGKTERPGAILIAGPTASGKSGLALRLARRLGGAVLNADSMQVYDGLQILSARPDICAMQGVPHHLYGHRDPASPYSVGDWRREIVPLLARIRQEGRVPIVCGGTGLYFRALLGGLDEAPAVPPAIREKWRARMAAEGPSALHRVLHDMDAVAADRVRPSDPQRIVRALELVEAQGASPRQPTETLGDPPIDLSNALKIVIAPDRSVLRERIASRFDAMLAAGALAEALAFQARTGALEGLAGKAIGLAELLAAHRGEMTMFEARERAVIRTRQYAKRQDTWFRNQFDPDWTRFEDADAVAV